MTIAAGLRALFALLLLAGIAAAAAATPPDAAGEAASYGRCMQLARDDPPAGLGFAASWQKRGGAHPAEHCAAVALIGLKRYAEAATRLAALAQAMDKTAPASLRAGVFDQASQAWLLAGEAARAYAAADAAVALAPDDPNLVVDRAEAAGLQGKYDTVVADLERVLAAEPNRVDALVYRASAYRALQRLDPALADADKAVRLAPDLPPALLERGNIRRLQGDRAGAREDWVRILDTAPASPEAATAKANLAALAESRPAPAEVKPDGRTKAAAGPGSSP